MTKEVAMEQIRQVEIQKIKQGAYFIRQVPEFLLNDDKFLKEALIANSNCFNYLSEDKKDYVLNNIAYMDKEVAMAIMEEKDIFSKLHYSLRNDKEVAMNANLYNVENLKYIDFPLNADKELILKAITEGSATAFQYADTSIKADKEFILQLADMNIYGKWEICTNMDVSLQNDIFFLEELKEIDNNMVPLSQDELFDKIIDWYQENSIEDYFHRDMDNKGYELTDPEVAKKLINYVGIDESIQFLSEDLMEDKKFMKEIIFYADCRMIEHLPEYLANDFNYLYDILEDYHEPMQYLDPDKYKLLIADVIAYSNEPEYALECCPCELLSNKDFIDRIIETTPEIKDIVYEYANIEKPTLDSIIKDAQSKEVNKAETTKDKELQL